MIAAFPKSQNPLKEPGIVLIDELDIHLHPTWQRNIAGWLRTQFPNIQFIVTTHSPMVAAGAGSDALTLKIGRDSAPIVPVTQGLFSMDVDDILKSEAFGLVSTFSPETEGKLSRLSALQTKVGSLNPEEDQEFQQLSLFVQTNNPYGIDTYPSPIEKRVAELATKHLK